MALTGYGVDRLSRIPGVQLVAGGQRRLSILSFNLDGVHPHDVGTVLDQHGVAVRVGHHCAQPLMDKLGLAGTVRASFGVYNDEADIDRLAAAVEACREMFSMSPRMPMTCANSTRTSSSITAAIRAISTRSSTRRISRAATTHSAATG